MPRYPSKPFTPDQASAMNKARAIPFDDRYVPEPNTGCFLWLGALDTRGYGIVSDDEGGSTGAHRKAWRRKNGPIPAGMWVLHRCDQPSCVNLDHLFLGTAKDNVADMISKGRHRFGGHHPSNINLKGGRE